MTKQRFQNQKHKAYRKSGFYSQYKEENETLIEPYARDQICVFLERRGMHYHDLTAFHSSMITTQQQKYTTYYIGKSLFMGKMKYYLISLILFLVTTILFRDHYDLY